MTIRIPSSTTLVLVLASALVVVLPAISQSAEPTLLTDSQLDQVTAGFLRIDVSANALAISDMSDTFSNTVTSTNVDVGQTGANGYIYTTGTGSANATAIGHQVYTGVSGGFDTDEEIVRVDVNVANFTLAVNQRAIDGAQRRAEGDLIADQRRADRRAESDQSRHERRENHAQRPLTQRQRDALDERYAEQDQRIADRRERQDAGVARRRGVRDRRILSRQANSDERLRARAAHLDIQPLLLQNETLHITVVTRRPGDES